MDTALPPKPLAHLSPAALGATIAEQAPRLRAFVRRQLAELADVEDVVQEVFMELTVAATLAEPITHLAGWLRRVARNRIIDRYRKRGREVELPAELQDEFDAASGPDPFDRLAAPAASEPGAILSELVLDELERAIAELPPAQREVFIAHELDGVSFKTLAETTGVNVNTLLGRKHAAVRTLKQRLEHLRTLLDP